MSPIVTPWVVSCGGLWGDILTPNQSRFIDRWLTLYLRCVVWPCYPAALILQITRYQFWMFILCFFPMVPAGCWFWPIPAILRKSLKVNEVFITSFIFPNSASLSTSFYILILAGYHFFLLLVQGFPMLDVSLLISQILIGRLGFQFNRLVWQKFKVEHVPDWFMWTIDIHWTSLTLPVSPENPRVCYSFPHHVWPVFSGEVMQQIPWCCIFSGWIPGRLKALTTSLLGSSPTGEGSSDAGRVRHGEMRDAVGDVKMLFVLRKPNRKAEDNVTFQLQE